LLNIFYPKLYAASLVELKPEFLRELGLRGVLLDLDNTVVRRDSLVFSKEVKAWLDELRAYGFKMCIISNNSKRR
jgi:predicted HAD superfamily phosphohydrolase YqeG